MISTKLYDKINELLRQIKAELNTNKKLRQYFPSVQYSLTTDNVRHMLQRAVSLITNNDILTEKAMSSWSTWVKGLNSYIAAIPPDISMGLQAKVSKLYFLLISITPLANCVVGHTPLESHPNEALGSPISSKRLKEELLKLKVVQDAEQKLQIAKEKQEIKFPTYPSRQQDLSIKKEQIRAHVRAFSIYAKGNEVQQEVIRIPSARPSTMKNK